MDLIDVRPAWAVVRSCVPPVCECTDPPHVAMLGLLEAAWRTARLCVWPYRDLQKLDRVLPVSVVVNEKLTESRLLQGMSVDAEIWWADSTGADDKEVLAATAMQAILLVRLGPGVARAEALPQGAGVFVSLVYQDSLELSAWWPVGVTLDRLVRKLSPELRKGGFHPSLLLAVGHWTLSGLDARARGRLQALPMDCAEGPTWLVCDPAALLDGGKIQ